MLWIDCFNKQLIFPTVNGIQHCYHYVGVDYPYHTKGFGITPLDMAQAPPAPGNVAAWPMWQMILKLKSMNKKKEYLSLEQQQCLLATHSIDRSTNSFTSPLLISMERTWLTAGLLYQTGDLSPMNIIIKKCIELTYMDA